jgi:DNA-binding transcriptional LysR family regulator
LNPPDIQGNIRATRSLTDFTRDGVDMSVRFGPGTWPGLISIKLYDEELVPVCSPAFRGGQLPRAPTDLLKVPLLHDERQPWSIWFESVGLDYRDTGQEPNYSEQFAYVESHMRVGHRQLGGLALLVQRGNPVAQVGGGVEHVTGGPRNVGRRHSVGV